MQISIRTVGYSDHPLEQFIELLRRHGVTALADVRSKPYSRANPQFNREAVKEAMKQAGIAYVFLGKELGARTDDPACYDHGKVRYDRFASTDLFQRGLERLREGATKYRLAIIQTPRRADCLRPQSSGLILACPAIVHTLMPQRLPAQSYKPAGR